MDQQAAVRRAQRLHAISQELRIVLDADLTTQFPPQKPPTFCVPDDERKADAVLGQLKIEESAGKGQTRGLKRFSSTFQKQTKPTTYTYDEIYAALSRVVEENGVVGVVEVLLKRFKNVQGDISLARRASSGMIKRITNTDSQDERGQLLQSATRSSCLGFVQLLSPLADQIALDESLQVALEKRDLQIIQTLLQYGANSTLYEGAFISAAKNGDHGLLKVLLGARRRVSSECVNHCFLITVANGSLPSVVLLGKGGADGSHGTALMDCVTSDRVDLVAAMMLGERPPPEFLLNQALESVFQTPFTSLNKKCPLIEVLLCGGLPGNAAKDALLQATLFGNIKLMTLLLTYGVDINHNGAAAVGHAIQRNRADLVAILLQDQSLKPELASELVKHISRAAPPADKIAILSKLLVGGATGTHCSELLITASEQDDIETAQLLLSYHKGDQGRPPACSVDYNAARCLQTAVSRNNIEMIKLLTLEGAPQKFSLANAFSSISPRVGKDAHFIIAQTLLRAGAAGPEVEAAFHTTLEQQKSIRLIELFVQFGVAVDEQTLFSVVTRGNPEILRVLLAGNIPSSICASAIPIALKISNLPIRFKTVKELIGPATASETAAVYISQAVIDVIQNWPNDLPLLSLLCREGKADVNFNNGMAVAQAVKQADPRILDILLHGQGSLTSSKTIERALGDATELPSSDATRQRKVEHLLRRAKPQAGMNIALIKAIRSASNSPQDVSVITALLDAGADVNANEGENSASPVGWAVTRNIPVILDLILSRTPSALSVSLSFPLVLKFQGVARQALSEKLLKAGACGNEISIVFCKVAKEGISGLPLLQLLLPSTNINYKDGLPLRIAVRQIFSELVDLILHPQCVVLQPTTKGGAFQEAMKLKSKKHRYVMVEKLMKSGIDREVASEALIYAANSSEKELVEVLLKSGSNVDHKGGLAILGAASCGEVEILKMLVDGKLCSKPTLSTLTSGFGGALTIKDKNKETYYQVLQVLLEAGMRGEAVDSALIHAVQDGEASLPLCELLYESGASVEWKEGEAINIAVQTSSTKILELVLRRQPSENVLKRAYRTAINLPKDQRVHIVDLILRAGKLIDKHVTRTLTKATKELPSDRQLIKILLNYGAFDDGESIAHAAKSLDLRTLTLLVNSPEAKDRLPAAFKQVASNESLWTSPTGVAIMKLMLKKGASGEAVAEALYQAIEKTELASDGLASEFLEVLLESGADVNYQHGLSIQRAAMQGNISLLEKIIPRANSESKAMALPYIFTCCDERPIVFKAIQIFEHSFAEGDSGVDIAFKHPDSNLEPLLFMALEKFPRDSLILKTLLRMGYHANQWMLCEVDDDIGMEPWPVLFWALDRPEKRISSTNIELLIDAGANVNFKTKSGMTPLILAIRNQRADILAKLISKGASVSVSDPDGTSPLALASRIGSTPMMEILLQADAESDDGSLHDAARELRCDSIRVLINYGHQVDYPSDRHEGRSALAELCLKSVNCGSDQSKIEEAVQCLIANDSDIRLRTPSEHDSGRTVFHYALDSSDPISILPVLLRLMWKVVNEDSFLYSDKTYTYSLTKFVEKDIYQGPKEQKEEILKLLRNKRALDRYWANSIDAQQPTDYCNAPKHIEEEILHQKARQKRKLEQREDVKDHLDLKQMTVRGEVEIMKIQTEAEITREREKAQVERELAILKAQMQLQLEMNANREQEHLATMKRVKDVNHQKELGQVRISTERTIRQEAFEEDRSRNVMKIEYIGKKIGIENEGIKARLAIEGNAMQDNDRILSRQHERELARIKMQKNLVERNMNLANTLQHSGMTQRQIGYITGEVA